MNHINDNGGVENLTSRPIRRTAQGQERGQLGKYVEPAPKGEALSPNIPDKVRRSLVRIEGAEGGLGTGFLLGTEMIVTCANCLPDISSVNPEDHPLLKIHSNDGTKSAWASIQFVDPIGDVAILLCARDDDDEENEAEQEFDDLTESLSALELRDTPRPSHATEPCYLLTSDNEWLRATAYFGCEFGREIELKFDEVTARVPVENFGTPVVDRNGQVVGILKVGRRFRPEAEAVCLPDRLPKWAIDLSKG